MFAQINRLIYKALTRHYPQPRYVIYNNGSKLKLHFTVLYDQFGIEHKQTMIKNTKANIILEFLHGEMDNMLHTAMLG